MTSTKLHKRNPSSPGNAGEAERGGRRGGKGGEERNEIQRKGNRDMCDGTAGRQLRQRRAQIMRDKKNEEDEMARIRETLEEETKERSKYLKKTAMVFASAVVVTLVALLNYTKPSFLFKKRHAIPPMYLATNYPPDVVIERDLPRFFRTYSIATPKNRHARESVIRVVNSRMALRQGTGIMKVVLKAWDSASVDKFILQRNMCGGEFNVAFLSGSHQRQDDLLMWCLLSTRLVEGFFSSSVEMTNNFFIRAKKRGMVVKRAIPDRLASASSDLISNTYYLHPRLQEDNDSINVAKLPNQVLNWLIDHPEEELQKPVIQLQEYIFELVSSIENEAKYMVLQEVCQDVPPRGSLGHHSSRPDDSCCFFTIPEDEAGELDDPEEDDLMIQRETLREGLIRYDQSLEEGSVV